MPQLETGKIQGHSSLTHSQGLIVLLSVFAAALDLVYKALICRFADHPASSFDVIEDVLEPLLQELPKKAEGEDRYAELLAYLEGLERDLRDPTPQNLEAIRAAAVEIARSRPSKKEETTKTRTNRTQKKGGNEGTRTHLSKQETLRKILDVIIVDPDAFDYAMNELL